jgi:drug/metabolite transporter (DMT)-like permease
MRTTRYWFPAKRYGWGWGFPVAWQGWAVLVVYIVLVVGGIPVVQVSKGDLAYLVYVAFLTLILVMICWLKGEPPTSR